VATYGEAWVDLHVRTDKIPKETDDALHKLGRDAETTLKKDVGPQWGDDISEGVANGLERNGEKFTRAIERGVGRRRVKMTETLRFDKDNNLVQRWVKTVTSDIEDAFADAGRPGGPFQRIGSGFADAIGAGFNVSGRSSLILVLVPLVGAIITLVGAALQAISSLAALLTTLPALLTAIGLQVGVLMLAFKGVGTAISGAFAAKNAKELQEAIKGLTPPAQEFVKALLPLKRFFQDLQMVAQANFFHFFGADVIPKIFKSIGPTVLQGFITLARVLGEMFRDIALFFASPSFREFLQAVIPATVDFLQRFGPSFITFVQGLLDLARVMLPILSDFGHMLSGTFTQLGVFFENAAHDPATLKWLHDMRETLKQVLELFGAAIDFIFQFLKSLNESGAGKEFLTALTLSLEALAYYIGTPAGQAALKGLADAAVALTYALIGLTIAFTGVFIAIEAVWQFLQFVGMHLDDIGAMILIGFAVIGSAVVAFFQYIWHGLLDFFRLIYEVTKAQIETVIAILEGLYHWFRDIGKRAYKAIQDAFANIGNWLYEKGRSLVHGLADGMLSMIGFLTHAGSVVGNAAANAIANYLPHSPAEKGPFSGDGSPMARGQKIITDLAAGMKMETPALDTASNDVTQSIVFGKDSVRVTYEGVNPTEQQARTTGYAVGSGILEKLAVRNTRLAVRTL